MEENDKELLKTTAEEIVGCFLLDPIAIFNITKKILNAPYFISQRIFWRKAEKFIHGIKNNKKFAKKFEYKINLLDPDEKEAFAKKIISIIDKIDDEIKIDFILKATLAFCDGKIDKETYYRICTTITRCIYTDLLFLQTNYSEDFEQKPNESIYELANSGLMVKKDIYFKNAGIIVPYEYIFTSFAKIVVEYALNYKIDGDSNV